MANNLKVYKNECLIEIENKKYYLYENHKSQWIDYYFCVYANSKHSRERKNCFYGLSAERVVIIGKFHNYILSRKVDKFEYDVIQFDKNILKLKTEKISTHKIHSILLNNDILYSYGDSENINLIWKKEIENRNKIIRKQKLMKISNA